MEANETPRRTFLKAGAGAAAAAATFGFNRVAQAEHHEQSEALIQLVKLTVKEGQEEAALGLLRTLTAAVEKEEPGVLAYVAHQSKKNSSEIFFYEVYKDQAAYQAHGTTAHMGEMRAQFMSLFVPPLDITPLSKVGGFTR